MPAPVVTTTTVSSACPTCGTITKSGKMSCCGRGGSWFGDCGSAGNADIGHTWSEGIRACKLRQFQTVVGQQQRASQPNMNASSDDASMRMELRMESEATSRPIPEVTPVVVPARMSMITAHDTAGTYDAGTTSNSIAAASAINIHDSSNMSTTKSILYHANPTITKATQSASTDLSIHISPSLSIKAREIENAVAVVTHMSIMLIIVCL